MLIFSQTTVHSNEKVTMSDLMVATFERRATDSTTNTEFCDQEKPREGGAEAWLTVAGSFLVYYATFGLVNSFGFFLTYYKLHLLSSMSPSTIAFIGTLQVVLMNSLATISGALCDSYGVKVTEMKSIQCTVADIFSIYTWHLGSASRVDFLYYHSLQMERSGNYFLCKAFS